MKIFYSTVIFLLFSILSLAQGPGNGFACQTALCLHENLGVPFNNGAAPATPPNSTSCGDTDNNYFFAFCAEQANVDIGVQLSNCLGMGMGGLELTVLETDDCMGFTEIDCQFIPESAGQGGLQLGLTPGNTYLLMVDGFMMDECDFLLAAQGISDLVFDQPTFDPPLPQTMCVGESLDLVINNANACAEYRYQANTPNILQLVQPTGGTNLSLNAVSPGIGEFCIRGVNFCANETWCYQVEVFPEPALEPIPTFTVCDRLIDFCDYQNVFNPPLTPDPLGQGWDVSFHLSQFDAESGNNPLPCPYDLINSFNNNFFIRTVNPQGCVSVTPFSLVYQEPRFDDIVVDPVCGPAEIDLGQEINLVDEFGTSYASVNFYRDEGDALADVGRLNPPVVSESGTYWVRVDSDTDPVCTTVESFEIVIVSTPEISADIPVPLICDPDTFLFDLSSVEVFSENPDYAIDDLDIRYYNDPPDQFGLDISLQPPIVIGPGTFYVVAVVPLNSPTQRYCASEPIPIELDTIGPPRVEISAIPPNCPEGETEIIFTVSGNTDFELEYRLSNGDIFNLEVGPGANSDFIEIENFTDTLTVTVISFEPIGSVQCDPEIGNAIQIPPPVQPSLNLLQSDTICRGDSIDLQFEFIGNGAFDVTFSDGVNEIELEGIENGGLFRVGPENTTTYQLLAAETEDGCIVDLGEEIEIVVNGVPDFEIIEYNCQGTQTYTVTIEFSGSSSGNYLIDGDPLNGNIYVSDPIPSGQPFEFELNDDNGCGPITIQGSHNCACDNNPGTMQADLLELCIGERAIGTHNGDNTNLPGDNFFFILHDDPGTMVGSIFGTNTVPEFDFDPGTMMTGVTYYISSVSGVDDGMGGVDFSDVCSQVSVGQPVVWNEGPDVQLTGPGVLCGNENAVFDVTFTSGTAPFTVEYNFNGVPQADAIINGQTGTITIDAGDLAIGTNTIEITGITDANGCFADPMLEADVEVLDDIEVTFDTECDNTNTTYEVILTISGGSGTYFVDGDPVTGTVYRAGPYPSGSGPYTFVVTDDAGCTTEITTPARDCDCETNPGSLSGNRFTGCEGEAISVNIATPSNLDGDDIEGLIVFDNLGNPAGSLIDFLIGSTTITYNAGTYNTGQTYYVAIAAGNDDGSGVVDLLGDPCAGIGNVVEIEWTELPDAQLTGPGVLCGNENAVFDVTFTSGTAPFTVEYNFNGVPQADAIINGQTGTITIDAGDLAIGTNTIEITGITDANGCFADPMLEADVEVLDDILVTFDTECDNTNTTYEVILTISGGSGTYFVDGDPVTGTVYRAGPYPSGSGPYTFVVTDDAGCTTEITTPARDCDCETNPGSLSGNRFTGCEGEAISVNIATPSNLDGDDIEGLIVFDNLGNPAGSLIDFLIGSTTITYNAGTYNTGQTYYVAIAAGNDDGSGVVDLLGDPCAGIGNVVEIEWTELPDAQLTGPGVLCGNEDAVFNLTFTSGTAPFVVEYSLNGTAQADANINALTGIITVASNGLNPGINTLEITGITDANGCFADPMVEVDVEVLDDIDVSFTTECDNTNTSYEVILAISGGSGTYFVDSDPVTGTVYRAGPYPSGSGPYTFVVTDDAGCTTEVTTLPRDCDCETTAGQLASGDLTACEGDAISVSIVTPSTLDGDDIEGLWIFDNQANPLNSLIEFVTGTTIAFDPGLYTPGQTYYVALAVGNNDGSGSVDLQGDACAALSNIIEIIWAERPVAEIDGPAQLVLSCGQADLILRTTGSSPQTADYQWILEQGASTNDPLTGPTLTVGSPGRYILELRTGDGSCFDRDEVTVIADQDLPTVILIQDGPLTCAQDMVTLDGSASDFGPNYEAEWELPDGSVLTGQGLTLTVNEEGTYRLTITDLDNSCSNSTEVTVSANRQLPVVDAGDDDQITCGVSSIELNASATGTTGSTSVVWYLDGVVIPGATSLSLTATLPGTYRVEVEDNVTGCIGQDVVQLTEDIGTIGSADVEAVRPSCPGERDGSIIVTNVTGGTAPYQYSINNNPFTTFPEFQLLRAGTYELEIRDANDCRYRETVEIEDGSSVQVQMGADTVIDIGDELILQPIIFVDNPDDVIAIDTIYISFVDSLSCTRCANPFAIIEPTVPANYVVTVITESGCEVSDSRFVGVNLEKPPFFIPTAFSPNGDGVNDRVELSFREPELVESVNEFLIYNRWGNLVYREATVLPGKRIQLWDGDFNGRPMLPQVFVYSFQVNYKDGSEEVFKGDITLFR